MPNPGLWSPPRLGLPRAILVALALEGLIGALLLWTWHTAPALAPPAKQQQVTTVDFVKLPPPPPPPKSVPMPRIVPVPPILKPTIVIPKKAKPKPVVHHPKPRPRPRPIHHKAKPVPKPKDVLQQHVVSHPAHQVVRARVPAPRVTPVSGPAPSAVAAYAAVLHVLIQNNVQVGGMIRQRGLTGGVRVSFVLEPSGGSARYVRVISGGANPLIRKAALDTVDQLHYPPFPKSFGPAPRTFQVVVQINVSN